AIEPMIETLGTRDDDAVWWYAVQLDRLPLLRLVPDEHAVRAFANQRFAGQMVPAPDAQRGWDAKRSSGAEVINLRGAEVDERGQEHDVRPLRFDKLANRRLFRN